MATSVTLKNLVMMIVYLVGIILGLIIVWKLISGSLPGG